MDNDSTGQESNDGASSDNDGASSDNDGASSDNDGSSGKANVKAGGEGHSMVVERDITYHDFDVGSSNHTKGDTTPARPNDSSNHTKEGTTPARPNDSSNHTKEGTTPASPNDSSNHNKEETKPARSNDSKEAPRNKPENQVSTSGTTENKDQQKSSSQASGNSTNVRDWLSKEYNSFKEWLHELLDSEKPEKISVDKAVKVKPAPEKKLFTNTSGSGDKIKSIAVEAAKNNFNNCSGSVREVANKRGIALGGAQANNQVQYMEENWREVSMDDAKKLADNGKLVIAGLAEPGNGHVAVVVKGNGVQREGKTWPNVAGGSLGTKEAKEKPGRAYSEGGNTIRDAWGAKKRDKVKFYTPE